MNGCIRDYDALSDALHGLLAHEKLAGVLGTGPTAQAFVRAEGERLTKLMDAATLCGWEPRQGPPIAWTQRRLANLERALS